VGVRSPVTYYGSKMRIAPWLVSLMPRHAHYVEPFCGGLSVLLAKPPSTLETVNDLDGDLVTFWRVLRDEPEEFLRVCELTPCSFAEFEQAKAVPYPDGITDVERARRVWVALTQSRQRVRGAGTSWKSEVDRTRRSPPTMTEWTTRLSETAERIRNVRLESAPAVEVVERYGGCDSVLLYLDPPYPMSARKTDGDYLFDSMRDADHADLADALHRCRAAVMLSGYGCELYDDLFGDWYRYTVPAQTDPVTGADRHRVEVVWSNRRLSSQLDLFGRSA
jgi:DNA adenine methylase